MRGHDQLIAMRVQGYRPASVEIREGKAPEWFARDWLTERASSQPVHARVCVEDDCIEVLDLRFVVGLTVMVTGTNPNRMRSLVAAVKAAGAKRVHALIDDEMILEAQ